MKQSIIIALLLVQTFTFGQNKVFVKLIDSYNYQTIQLNNSFVISHKKFTVDTINDLITILKPRGHKLKFSSSSHDPKEVKMKLRKFKNDTISFQLTPNKSTIAFQFHKIWENKNPSNDTLYFESLTEFDRFISSHLNYLTFLFGICDNGFCNYSNSYRYEIEAVSVDSIYSKIKITKSKNYMNKCDEFETYLYRLDELFPSFKIENHTEKITKNFFIRL